MEYLIKKTESNYAVKIAKRLTNKYGIESYRGFMGLEHDTFPDNIPNPDKQMVFFPNLLIAVAKTVAVI